MNGLCQNEWIGCTSYTPPNSAGAEDQDDPMYC